MGRDKQIKNSKSLKKTTVNKSEPKRRCNDESSSSSDESIYSDEESEAEMDQHEYRKFLQKIFPSKHLENKIKAGKRLKKVLNDNTDSDYLATITFESSRDGIGADVSFDPDKALKTAQAEALKKACHQFGIALYLWDDEQRGYLDLQRKAAISEDDLKRLAVAYVQRTLGTDEMPSKDIIADTLGMDADDLSNNTLLRAALTNKGAL